MSAVASVGSSSSSLYFEQLQQQRIQNDQDQIDGSPSADGPQQAGGLAKFLSRFEAAAKSIGIDPAKLPEIEKQVQEAIAKAQQQGNGSGDQRSAVRDAINGVLKDNGIDPAKFESAIKAQETSGAKAGGAHRHRHGRHKPQAAAETTSAINPTDVQPGQTTGTLVDVAA